MKGTNTLMPRHALPTDIEPAQLDEIATALDPATGHKMLQHDTTGSVYAKHGNLYVTEQTDKIANPHGYGHHYEHPSTTRARALKRVRAALPNMETYLVGTASEVHFRRDGYNVRHMRFSVVTTDPHPLITGNYPTRPTA